MALASQPTRRERLRAATLEEIRQHAYAQLAQGGPAALSLNGIAKAMGMSGAAMYRYFDSRESLMTTLICETYEDLAASLEGARTTAARRGPGGRMRAVADAYRAWALAQPHRYRLVLQSALSTSAPEPERIIAAAQRAMDVLLGVLIDLDLPVSQVSPAALGRELRRWGARSRYPDAEPGLYLQAQVMWSRLHGVISLEIEGVYDQMGVDADAIYAGEVRRLGEAAVT